MSLDWDVTRMEDRLVKFPSDENGQMNDALHVMIWLTIPVGIGHVTEDNVDEWWVRVNLWQQTIGSGFNTVKIGNPGDYPPDTSEDDRTVVTPFLVTKEQAYNAVGLLTNAGPKSKTEFLKDLHAAAHRTML